MARTVTRTQIRDRVRKLADIEGATVFVPDADINDLIDVHTCEVWEKLVESGPAEYYLTRQTITTIAGTLAYNLASDFTAAVDVYAAESTTRMRPIQPLRSGTRADYEAPNAVFTIYLDYIPACPVYANDSATFDGVAGYEELIVAMVARDLLTKQSSDVSAVQNKINQLMARIEKGSTRRDRAGPFYVRDVYALNTPYWAYNNRINAYRIVGGSIELYQRRNTYP